MTDMVKDFNLAADSLKQGIETEKMKNATLNLRDIFARRNIFFGNNGTSNS